MNYTKKKEIAKGPTNSELKKKHIFVTSNHPVDPEDQVEISVTTTEGEEITVIPRIFKFTKKEFKAKDGSPLESFSISGRIKGRDPKKEPAEAVVVICPDYQGDSIGTIAELY